MRWRMRQRVDKMEDEMKGRLLLDVVIGQSTTLLKLVADENKALLVETKGR
jgi:hypothetical protein